MVTIPVTSGAGSDLDEEKRENAMGKRESTTMTKSNYERRREIDPIEMDMEKKNIQVEMHRRDCDEGERLR